MVKSFFWKAIESWLYVDKTHFIPLINNKKKNNVWILLTRPRRFWKSLFLDMLKEYYSWNKESFKETYIYDHFNVTPWEYVILHFNFASYNTTEKLNEYINFITEFTWNNYNLDLYKSSNSILQLDFFLKIVYNLWKKITILIDEYDAPMLHNKDNTKLLEFLNEFYQIIKNNNVDKLFVTW